VLAAPGDCSFICPGSPVQYCGAGNRLEMYKLSSAVTTTSVSSTSSRMSSSSSRTGTSSSSSWSSTTVAPTSSTSTRPSTSSTIRSSSSSSIVSPITSSTAVPTLRIVKSAGLYNYHGCFTEGTNVRALGAASYPSDTNTVEQCVAACSPYKFAGAEYGRECWCADSFGAGSLQVADSDCSMTCAGDKYEYCGAGNRLTVYIRNGTEGSVSNLSTKSSSTSTLVSSTRAGSTSSRVSSTPVLTLTSSPSSTRPASSTQSSTSSRSSTRQTTSSSSTSSRSSTHQTTSSSSTSSRSSTRQTTSSSSTSSRSSSTTPSLPTSTQTAPTIKSTIGAYSYYGCQTEGTNVRALSGASFYNYPSMTLEQCASNCSGFKYWGVEYGGECYCGNSFGAGSIAATENDCNFLCPGDNLEYCGAGNRLSVYVLKT